VALRVLVTGGAGNLGRQITGTLRAAGHPVIVCGRASAGEVDSIWDIAQHEAPQPDCQPEVVVHAAARVGSYQQPLAEAGPLMAVNVLGTLRVARWCVARGVRRLIIVSSAIVYGEWQGAPKSEVDPVKPWVAGAYAVSKWCGEQVAELVKPAGCELTVLRLSSLYGPGYRRGLIQRLLQEGRETGAICLQPPFDDAFDLQHVVDAAHTVSRAVESSQTGLWNLGSGKLAAIRELAEICAGQTGAQLTFADALPARPGRILNWMNDQAARSELGHGNQVSLEQGIAEIASAARESV
jgi:UDP-glucose 4-epimerase